MTFFGNSCKYFSLFKLFIFQNIFSLFFMFLYDLLNHRKTVTINDA